MNKKYFIILVSLIAQQSLISYQAVRIAESLSIGWQIERRIWCWFDQEDFFKLKMLFMVCPSYVNDLPHLYITPLHKAISKKSLKMIKFLIANGANVNQINSYSETPLQTAVASFNIEIVKLLIAHGADVNKNSKYKHTPLQRAAFSCQTEIVKLLVAHGADIHETDERGNTLLYTAAIYGGRGKNIRKMKMVELLIEYGVDVNAICMNGNTPLHAAVDNCDIEIAKLLLAHGADLTIKNKEGKTALDVCKDPEIKKLLEEAINKKHGQN